MAMKNNPSLLILNNPKRLKKGTPEAKAFMAKLRSMQGKKRNPLTKSEREEILSRARTFRDHARKQRPGLFQQGYGYGASDEAAHIEKQFSPPISYLRGNPPTKKARQFIGKKIRKLRREGFPPKQSVAIAHSMARKKGYRSVPKFKRNPASRFGECPRGFPRTMWNDADFQSELASFYKKHGKVPVRITKIKTPDGFPKYLSVFGKTPEVKYDAPKASFKGKRIHHFTRGAHPWLVTSRKWGPKGLAFVGGKFRSSDWIYK